MIAVLISGYAVSLSGLSAKPAVLRDHQAPSQGVHCVGGICVAERGAARGEHEGKHERVPRCLGGLVRPSAATIASSTRTCEDKGEHQTCPDSHRGVAAAAQLGATHLDIPFGPPDEYVGTSNNAFEAVWQRIVAPGDPLARSSAAYRRWWCRVAGEPRTHAS